MEDFPTRLRQTASAVAQRGLDFAGFSDAALLDAQRTLAEHRRIADVFSAALAGELDRRSAHELGSAGLAQRNGFLTTAGLIQSVTGGGRAEAARHVAVGAALDTPLGIAVLEGDISVEAADAVRRGLGATDEMAVAVASEPIDADRLFTRARDLRDELDADAVARREKEQRDLRYLKYSRRPDGMVRGAFLLDALDGALVTAAFDAVLSPRRGPRFDSDSAREVDPRSNEQVAADSFVAMMRLAVDADPGTVFGSRRPAVRIVVNDRELRSGYLEDSHESVSGDTVRRLLCDTGFVGVSFDDDGQCMNVGRTQRLFTERQRIGLAVRDGGCRFPGCDRPPSWCEAHHVNEWLRDDGRTDLADGVLLCRRHHLLVHNNHWRVAREGAEYWAIPPRELDPGQQPIDMPPRVLVKQLV